MILAGDIVADSYTTGCIRNRREQTEAGREKAYASQKHAGLAEIISEFVKTEGNSRRPRLPWSCWSGS